MNAKDARLKALSISDNPDMREILSCIEIKVNTGEFYTWYYKNINAHQLKHLKAEGYKVENLSCQRDGTLYKISW